MIIERLRLVNYIGIFHGFGKTDLELDFTKDSKGNPLDGNNRLFMFNGKNGSGKTTIMSQLNPDKDSNDDRDSLILPGENGRKEIDIRDGEDLYEIVHHMKQYGSKSFIKKNGEELNPNGGIRTFKDIVYEELGYDKDFIRIGRIGSNVDSFVKLSTAERKKYISKFLPDIEDYEKAFETVKEKFREYDSKIKFIVNELSSLDDIMKLKAQQEGVSKEIETLTKLIEESNIKSGGQLSVLSELKENNNFDNTADVFNKLTLEKKKLNDMKVFVLDFNAKYDENPNVDELKDKISELKLIKSDLDGDIKSLSGILNEKRSNKIKSNNEMIKLNNQLNQYSNDVALASLEKELVEVNNNVNNIKTQMDNSIFSGFEKDKSEVSREVSRTVDKIDSFIKYIQGSYGTLTEKDLFKESNINIFEKSLFGNNVIEETYSKYRLDKLNIETKITEKNKEFSKSSHNLKFLEDLKKRPEDCKIDTCPFIQKALSFIGLEKELDKIEVDIQKLRKEVDDIEVIENTLDDLVYEFKMYKNAKETLLNDRNDVINLFADSFNNDIVSFITDKALVEIIKVSNEFISDAENYIDLLNQLERYTSQISNLENSIKSMKDNAEIIKSLTESRDSYSKELETLTEEVISNSEMIEEKEKELSKIKTKLFDYEEFLQSKISYNDVKSLITGLEDEFDKLTKNKNIFDELTEENKTLTLYITDLKSDLYNKTNLLNDVNTKISKINNYIKRKEEMEKDFINLKTLKNALDPNKGIPVYFIQNYLEKTQEITNNLLDLAFDNMFRVEFDINSSDFNIKVNAEGDIKEDIKLASQGELALTTISLSFALLQQTIKKFNVVSLDEIDGGLDGTNRRIFIDILERQMDTLGIEQLFIISHNKAFDTTPMNMLLLKNHDVDVTDKAFMRNKNVIYNYDE